MPRRRIDPLTFAAVALCLALPVTYLACRSKAPPPAAPAGATLEAEVEALRLERIAAQERCRNEADIRGEDGIAAAEAERRRSWPAYRERLLALYQAHGQAPPKWLADPKALNDW
jgi:hypothetical protein